MGITIHFKFKKTCTVERLLDDLKNIKMIFGEIQHVDVSPVMDAGNITGKSMGPWTTTVGAALAGRYGLSLEQCIWFAIQAEVKETTTFRLVGLSTVLEGECQGSEPFNLPFAGIERDDGLHDWSVTAFTKTQYASNFKRAHKTVCDLIDIVKIHGFDTTVNDEAGYYVERDDDELVVAFSTSDSIIKWLGQALEKRFGDDARGPHVT